MSPAAKAVTQEHAGDLRASMEGAEVIQDQDLHRAPEDAARSMPIIAEWPAGEKL